MRQTVSRLDRPRPRRCNASRRVMGRSLAVAAFLGSVGLLAALHRRRQHLHAVDGLSERVKCRAIRAQVHDNPSALLDPALSVFVLKDSGQGNATHTADDPVKRSFVEHEDGSRSGSLQFDVGAAR